MQLSHPTTSGAQLPAQPSFASRIRTLHEAKIIDSVEASHLRKVELSQRRDSEAIAYPLGLTISELITRAGRGLECRASNRHGNRPADNCFLESQFAGGWIEYQVCPDCQTKIRRERSYADPRYSRPLPYRHQDDYRWVIDSLEPKEAASLVRYSVIMAKVADYESRLKPPVESLQNVHQLRQYA